LGDRFRLLLRAVCCLAWRGCGDGDDAGQTLRGGISGGLCLGCPVLGCLRLLQEVVECWLEAEEEAGHPDSAVVEEVEEGVADRPEPLHQALA